MTWDPTQEPGLLLWLDAATGFTPSQWSDQSGHGNHAVQSTGGLQPAVSAVTYNNRPAVHFSGAQYMTLPGALARSANTTFYASGRVDVGVAYQGIAVIDGVYLYGCLPAPANNQWGTWEGVPYSSGQRADLWRQMCVHVAGTAGSMRLRTDGVDMNPGVSGFSTGGGCWLGSDRAGANFLSGDLTTVIVYDHELSPTVLAQLEAWDRARYGQVLVITDGNSLVHGHNAPTTTAPLEICTFSQPVYRFNNGAGGKTTAQMITLGPTQIDILLYPKTPTILIGMEIRNDIFTGGLNAAQCYANVVTYCQARKAAAVAAGMTWFRLAWSTCLPSLLVSDATRDAANALVRVPANWQTFADELIDVGADPTMGQDGQYSNPTNYISDQIHPTNAGNVIIASYYSAGVNQLLAPLPPRPVWMQRGLPRGASARGLRR